MSVAEKAVWQAPLTSVGVQMPLHVPIKQLLFDLNNLCFLSEMHKKLKCWNAFVGQP
jgi:hypothetical protein